MATQPPKTPTLQDLQKEQQKQLEQAFKDYFGGMQYQTPTYTPPPTFSASYYMPTNMLNQMRRVAQAQPQVDQQQLRQIAEQQVGLLTNPQIEALRRQIAELKNLIPQEQRAIQQAYNQATANLSRGVSDVLASILDQIQRQEGGLRPGVYEAVTAQLREAAQPLFEQLGAEQQYAINSVIGALEVEKQNAQNLLQTILANRPNMTQAQYNALYDEAVNRFTAAQQAQLNILSSLLGLESQARQQAARLAQERVAARNEYEAQRAELYNRFIDQLIGLRRGEFQAFSELLGQEMKARQAENLEAWRDFLSGPSVPTPAAGLDLLRLLRDQIEASVGKEGYQELRRWLEEQPRNQINPQYRGQTIGAPSEYVQRMYPPSPPNPRPTRSPFWDWFFNFIDQGLIGYLRR